MSLSYKVISIFGAVHLIYRGLMKTIWRYLNDLRIADRKLSELGCELRTPKALDYSQILFWALIEFERPGAGGLV